MAEKIKKALRYIVFAVLTNILYGIAAFFLFTWLVGYSLLLVYLVNLALIIVFLAWESIGLKTLETRNLAADLKKEDAKKNNLKKNVRDLKAFFDSYVSFKTMLYLFYIFILIFAQVIEFYPALLNESLTNFIHANNYSILVLIAADQLVTQFSKDKSRIGRVLAKLDKDLGEDS